MSAVIPALVRSVSLITSKPSERSESAMSEASLTGFLSGSRLA